MQWKCKLCKSIKLTPAYSLEACTLLECSACGFRFIDFLDSDYASVNDVDERTIAKTTAAIKAGLESSHQRIEACVDLVKMHVSRGPILDIGTGGGSFLAVASALFPGSQGIELAPVLFEICRRSG